MRTGLAASCRGSIQGERAEPLTRLRPRLARLLGLLEASRPSSRERRQIFEEPVVEPRSGRQGPRLQGQLPEVLRRRGPGPFERRRGRSTVHGEGGVGGVRRRDLALGRLLVLARGHTPIAEIPTVASVLNLEALRTGSFSLASRNGREIRAGGPIPAGRSR